MATFIISGSRGTDDPTMATLPFMAAKVAKEQGHEVVLWLWNEAVTLGRKGTAEHVTGVNLTPLKDLLVAVQAANIPIWVCGACAVARQIGAGDLVAGATIKGMPATSSPWPSESVRWRFSGVFMKRRLFFVKRISLFARDSRGLREKRDCSEFVSVRTAPVVHVSLVSFTIHARRETNGEP